MIFSIKGMLQHLSETTAVIEDKSGVCWEAEISAYTRAALTALIQSHTSIYTYLYHREDQMTLFGFSSLEEKKLFLLLLKVNGIGPKQGVKMMSSGSPAGLIKAIIQEDEGYLTALPGIGLKGAKKIILSLKDTLTKEYRGELAAEQNTSGTDISQHDQLVEALTQMGFDSKEALKTVRRLIQDSENQQDSEGELLRKAIVLLS